MDKIKTLLKSRRFIAVLVSLAVVSLKEVGGINVSEDFIWQMLAATGIFVGGETVRSSEGTK